MRVACWTIPELDPLEAALIAAGYDVYRADPHTCRAALAQDDADVALLPTLDVLLAPSEVQLLPGAGVATLSFYPYARVHLRHGLDRVGEIGFDPRARQEALLAQLLIKEHYLSVARFVPVGEDTPASTLDALDGLLVTAGVEAPDPALTLDLGQEWYELTTRPMVWGLFAALPDRIGPDAAWRLREVIRTASPAGDARSDEQEATSVVRTRLDEFALQGLEEFVTYLFYTGTLDEIANLRFVELPEPDQA